VERIQHPVAVGLEGLIPLPERAEKPRDTGVTHVVDPGLTTVEAAGLMEVAAAHVDVVRL
jgi:phosphosulfolactate synthase